MIFSEIYNQYDKLEEANLSYRRELEERISKNYLSFYERAQQYLGLHPIVTSLIFGVILFLFHLSSSIIETKATTETIIIDFSFFISILNSIGLFLVFNATEKMRDFLISIIQLIKSGTGDKIEDLLNIYKSDFLGTRSIFIGITFGVINSYFGYLFGIPYLQNGQIYLAITFFFQLFTIGFIGGLTVNASMVIVKLINRISIKESLNLTYFYPDKCAGTLIIGNLLFIFSIHFIIIGLFIFLFIHKYPWTALNGGNIYLVALAQFWKIFPFILSGAVFFIPVKKLNLILKEYKIFEQLRVRKRLNYLTGIIMSLESDRKDSKEKIEVLDNHYQKLVRIDKEIGELNTWPYNLKYRATFLSIFLPVIIAIIIELSKKGITKIFDFL